MSRRWIPVLVLFALVMLPSVAHACPVCFDPRDENRSAFVATAALLTLLPLGVVGGVGLWLRRRFRDLQKESDQEPPPADD
jgi:hypothetical protein